MKSIHKGKFIVFEGLDGSGQSTQASLLNDYLTGRGHDVLVTKEPTKESEIGQKIRRILNGEAQATGQELQALYVQDRKWHLENIIEPHLDKNEKAVVICDRYFFSTLAFGGADGLDKNWLWDLNKDFLAPDIVFFMDTKADTCLARIEKRGGEKELFEKKEKLELAYQKYQEAFRDLEYLTQICIINGEASIEAAHQEIKQKYEEKFSQNH